MSVDEVLIKQVFCDLVECGIANAIFCRGLYLAGLEVRPVHAANPPVIDIALDLLGAPPDSKATSRQWFYSSLEENILQGKTPSKDTLDDMYAHAKKGVARMLEGDN